VRPLLVDLEPEWRGGQNQALLLLKGLRARGIHAELVAVAGSALEERAAAAGIPVHQVDRFWKRGQAALELRFLLKSGRFDLAHVNEPHALTAAWLARAHRRVPLVISRRVGYPIGQSWLAQRRYRAAARIVAISHWAAEQAAESGASKDKLAIVYEGVDLPPAVTPELRRAARARWGIPENIKLLGCVGVLSSDKGQEWLIRALAAVRAEFPHCHLLLAGDGPCRPKLEALAKQLGVNRNVILVGFVKEVESVYAALDIFLLPSFFEALSNALMSAMAYGLPSIAFKQGGPAEIIQDGKSGLLVEPGNEKALSDAIKALLGNYSFAKKLGDAGRQRIEDNFSARKMVEGMIRIYEETLSSRKSGKI